jgi:transcription-repair coupling factor (superfamily II helicase)
MLAFVEGRADVLVATTIIENGLDIPRANTMIINRADHFGLAQLYQLRGRVGRSDRPRLRLLLVPPDLVLSEIARKRLAAMREFSELGAGFPHRRPRSRAARRGEPAGRRAERPHRSHRPRSLRQAPRADDPRVEGRGTPEGPRATLNLRVDLRLPDEYVPEVHQRMTLYKRISQVRDGARSSACARRSGIATVRCPWKRRGSALRGVARRADALGVLQADLGTHALHVRLGPQTPLAPERLVAVTRSLPGASLSPEGVLRAPLSSSAHALDALDALLGRLKRRDRRLRASSNHRLSKLRTYALSPSALVLALALAGCHEPRAPIP